MFLTRFSLERAGIFTDEFELAYVKDAEPILFDRKNDPDQTHNFFSKPKYKQVTSELNQRIIKHSIAVEAPAFEWLKRMPR